MIYIFIYSSKIYNVDKITVEYLEQQQQAIKPSGSHITFE